MTSAQPQSEKKVQQYGIRVVSKKPQSREHFVQGLEIHDNTLYMSTGQYGKSHLLRYEFSSGKLLGGRKLSDRLFAEGLTVMGDYVYQLTWRSRALIVYDKEALTPQRWLQLPGEGWGMTNNGVSLIFSDGSANLQFMAPSSGKLLGTLTVTENGKPLTKLNELEWIKGKIFANVWQTNRIVTIDPDSGVVEGSIDLTGLLPTTERKPGTDVLNGIAYDLSSDSIWVTGKRWPWLYEIELDEIEP